MVNKEAFVDEVPMKITSIGVVKAKIIYKI
jgi:hypothetical protein